MARVNCGLLADTKRSPDTADFHGSVPVILGQIQTFCNYMQNTFESSQTCFGMSTNY